MGRRLKQIKRNDLGESGKKVIDSLIADKSKTSHKEETHEPMRCKVEILEGSVKKTLSDSFVVNTICLRKTLDDIISKYGNRVQFKITNLYDEKVVAKRSLYTGGYDKAKDDKEHFSKQMELVKRIHKLKEEGKTIEEVKSKISLAAKSYIQEIYNSTEEEMKQKLRNTYDNQTLGKSDKSEVISKDLNPKNTNIEDSDPDEEKEIVEENHEE